MERDTDLIDSLIDGFGVTEGDVLDGVAGVRRQVTPQKAEARCSRRHWELSALAR